VDRRPTRHAEIAETLKARIDNGIYAEVLPPLTAICDEFGVAPETARRAVEILRQQGLVQPTRRAGTKIRRLDPRLRLERGRIVHRDHIGYYFDSTAQGWIALEPPTITRLPVPDDVAALLGIPTGEIVVARERIMGTREPRRPFQLATSYLPLDLVDELPVLEAVDTGPGGIYDRIEEVRGPLAWQERAGSRVSTERHARLLGMQPPTPVLRFSRITTDPTGRVCEVNVSDMDSDVFELGYHLERGVTAVPHQ
jgi:GntR family transcriptional regulator